ncbi:MAG: hypothetical protein M1839_006953 [Geoglossum umbratile]|nr:MAG: hypothetical protein M1839_006953 [Geoglossum umbratile]
MAHPHPDVPRIESAANFRGAVLISPWVTFDISAPAMKSNQYKDCLKDIVLRYWGDQFMGAAEVDPYNQPLTAPPNWWSTLTVDEILVVAGRDELLVDDIREFAKKLEASHDTTTTVITVNEAHAQPIMDKLFGYTADGEQARAVKTWVSSRLSG